LPRSLFLLAAIIAVNAATIASGRSIQLGNSGIVAVGVTVGCGFVDSVEVFVGVAEGDVSGMLTV
jgi:hypothetical protein